jgi:hypothetical protein
MEDGSNYLCSTLFLSQLCEILLVWCVFQMKISLYLELVSLVHVTHSTNGRLYIAFSYISELLHINYLEKCLPGNMHHENFRVIIINLINEDLAILLFFSPQHPSLRS